MASEIPSRWLGPIALVAAVIAVGVVVTTSGSGDPAASRSGPAQTDARTQERASTTATTSTTPGGARRSYTVKPGDSFALIAERTGTTVEKLQELNPNVDSSALSVGQRLRLPR